eukprot:13908416-Heterocapsa_arctica.AAC.1
MLKAAEAIPGWEDKVEELRMEIKEQLKLSNQEQMTTREAQGTALLLQVSWKTKEKAAFKSAMLHHQEKTDLNAKGYQKMKDDIRIAYAELEEIGWNQ